MSNVEVKSVVWVGDNDLNKAQRLAEAIRTVLDPAEGQVDVIHSENTASSLAAVMWDLQPGFFPPGFGMKGQAALQAAAAAARGMADAGEGRKAVGTLSNISEFILDNAMNAHTPEQKQWVLDQVLRMAHRGDESDYKRAIERYRYYNEPEDKREEIPDEGPWSWNWSEGEGPTKLRFK